MVYVCGSICDMSFLLQYWFALFQGLPRGGHAQSGLFDSALQLLINVFIQLIINCRISHSLSSFENADYIINFVLQVNRVINHAKN